MTYSVTCLLTRRMLLMEAIMLAAVMGALALSGTWTRAPRLQATVHCDSQRFRITNNDKFAWTNVDLELNRSLVNGAGYHYRPGDVAGGRTIVFLASQFTRDGDHFNVASERLGELRITCDLPGGGKGLYTYSW
jgi:hypothetical protein